MGWTQSGEWLEYTLEVSESQKVEVLLMAASETGGGEIFLEVNDSPLTNHLYIQTTGSELVYDTIIIEDLYLHQGVQKLKIHIVEGGFNLDRIEIKAYELFILGVPEFESEISLYPNPATSSIRLKLPEGMHREIELWSVNGRLQRKVEVHNINELLIPIEDLPEGIYILNLVSENRIYRKKFIKQ